MDSEFIDSRFIDEKVGFHHVLWEKEAEVLKKPEWVDRSVINRTFRQNDGATKYMYAFPDHINSFSHKGPSQEKKKEDCLRNKLINF